jgi:hypothetical protein
LSHLRNCRTVFCSSCTILYSHQSRTGIPSSSSLQILDIVWF